MIETSSYGNDDKITENYFYHLKNLEFNVAKEETKKIKDENLYQLLDILAEMRISNTSIKVHELSNENSDNSITSVIENLVRGYSQTFLINNPDNLGAFKSFQKALDISTTISNEYLAKASIIAQLDLFKREIFIGSKQYKLYLKRFKSLKSDSIDEVLYIFYSIIFFSKGDGELSIDEMYEASFYKLDSILPNLNSSHKLYVQYYYEKAIYSKINQDYEKSIKYFRKAIVSAKGAEQFNRFNCVTNWQIADTYLSYKKPNMALDYLAKSEGCAITLKDDFYDIRLCSEILAELKDYSYAYNALKKSVDIEYNLGYKNNTLESSVLAEQSNVDLLEFNNLKLENRRILNRNWLIAASLALMFGAGIAVLLQKNTTKKRLLAEQEVLLKQERVDNLLKEQELVSIDAMIAGQEKERQRVANELHDDLGSLMATIKLHFDNSKVGNKDPGLQNAQKLLDQAYQKVRSMAHSKNSGVMSNQGLLPAIKKMAQVITETNALKVSVEDFGMGDRLENSLELNLFRMVQELIANTIKHAEASKVSIQLTQHKDNLNIIIEDNGKGFDRSKVDADKTGMGLTTIEKRVEHLEGNFTVDSVLGKGTSILIDIPV